MCSEIRKRWRAFIPPCGIDAHYKTAPSNKKSPPLGLGPYLVQPAAVEQGRQLVHVELCGVQESLDPQKVPLRDERADGHSHLAGAERPAPAAAYPRGGEERRGELQQALDLDLHGGQGALADRQRLRRHNRPPQTAGGSH